MNKFKITFLLLLVLSAIHLKAQDSTLIPLAPAPTIKPDSGQLDKISAGVGVGYEYGGVGGNAIYYPLRNIGVFGGAGWYYVGFGYNAGVKVRAIINDPSTVFIPFVEFFYGKNSYVYYADNPQYNKTFSNFTFGGGLDIRPNNSKLGFISLALYVPLRTPDIKNYTDNYVSHFYGVNPSNKLFWLNASIGYKFILWK